MPLDHPLVDLSPRSQILADPQFLAHSASTLTDLINIPFTAGKLTRSCALLAC